MGTRRMFSPSIVRSDNFLELPISARELYFQLGIETDDRGYINNANSVLRLIGASKEDLLALVESKFLLERVPNKLYLQKHFNINNKIRSDRFRKSNYETDLVNIYIESNGAYTTDSSKGEKIKAEQQKSISKIENDDELF